MEFYKNECVFHFCVLSKYLNRNFCCFPPEVINLINHQFIIIYGLISKLPFVCDKPGNYYITKDLYHYGSVNGITIMANNVILDLQKYTIYNYAPTYTVHSVDVYEVTITNGNFITNVTHPLIYVNGGYVTISHLHITYLPQTGTIMPIKPIIKPVNVTPTIKEKDIICNKSIKIIYNKRSAQNYIPKNQKRCKKSKYY